MNQSQNPAIDVQKSLDPAPASAASGSRAEEIATVIVQSGRDPVAAANERCAGDRDLLMEVLDSLGKHAGRIAGYGGPDVRTDEMFNQKVGGYRIHWRIGSGGNGDVYLATRLKEPNQQVAIKFLSTCEVDPEGLRRRFRRERQIVALLNHPYIVKLFDADQRDGRPYFVMEYVAGQPLDKYCNAKRLTVRQRLDLFLRVCDAVAYLHTRLIVHRDLKPGNVLADAHGNPRILDFGIAKLLQPELMDGSPLTIVSRRHPMTADYASPEQWKGEAITSACDVYSLGVMLFELLTGRLPHPRIKDPDAYGQIVCRQDSPPASKSILEHHAEACRETSQKAHADRLEGDIDAILAKALERDANERYPTVAALAEDIERHIRFIPVRARSNVFGYRLARFLRRNRQSVIASAAVLLSLIFGLGLALTQWREAARNLQLAQQARKQLDNLSTAMKTKVDDVHLDHKRRIAEICELAAAPFVSDPIDYTSRKTAEEWLKSALKYWNASGENAKALKVSHMLDGFAALDRQDVGKTRGGRLPELNLPPAASAASGQSYFALGQLLQAAGDAPAARDAYQSCATTFRELRESGDTSRATRDTLQICEAALSPK